MAKPEWGSKRQCPSCGARFYDLGRAAPITCIACAHTFEQEVLLKPRRGRPDDKIAAVIAAPLAVVGDDEVEADEELNTVSLDELAAEEAEDDDDAAVIAIIPDIDDVDADLLADSDEPDKGLLETSDDDEEILPKPELDE